MSVLSRSLLGMLSKVIHLTIFKATPQTPFPRMTADMYLEGRTPALPKMQA